jgi:hypothetical protein
MNTPNDVVEQLAVNAAAIDLDALAGMPAAALVELTAGVERLGRIVDAMRIATATVIEQRSDRWLGTAGLAQSYGYRRGFELVEYRRGFELVEQLTGVSGAEARRRARLGESVRPRVGDLGNTLPPLYPVLSDAMACGRVGMDAARTIVAELAAAAPRADADALRLPSGCSSRRRRARPKTWTTSGRATWSWQGSARATRRGSHPARSVLTGWR